ncbi:hypothetical protein DFJ74DRAFT_688523 [Hyaloraphidium curvatum]|nr:hypothetical protein DFJ74DRAFT_688523 [Hyaloraphidium curvatum]
MTMTVHQHFQFLAHSALLQVLRHNPRARAGLRQLGLREHLLRRLGRRLGVGLSLRVALRAPGQEHAEGDEGGRHHGGDDGDAGDSPGRERRRGGAEHGDRAVAGDLDVLGHPDGDGLGDELGVLDRRGRLDVLHLDVAVEEAAAALAGEVLPLVGVHPDEQGDGVRELLVAVVGQKDHGVRAVVHAVEAAQFGRPKPDVGRERGADGPLLAGVGRVDGADEIDVGADCRTGASRGTGNGSGVSRSPQAPVAREAVRARAGDAVLLDGHGVELLVGGEDAVGLDGLADRARGRKHVELRGPSDGEVSLRALAKVDVAGELEGAEVGQLERVAHLDLAALEVLGAVVGRVAVQVEVELVRSLRGDRARGLDGEGRRPSVREDALDPALFSNAVACGAREGMVAVLVVGERVAEDAAGVDGVVRQVLAGVRVAAVVHEEAVGVGCVDGQLGEVGEQRRELVRDVGLDDAGLALLVRDAGDREVILVEVLGARGLRGRLVDLALHLDDDVVPGRHCRAGHAVDAAGGADQVVVLPLHVDAALVVAVGAVGEGRLVGRDGEAAVGDPRAAEGLPGHDPSVVEVAGGAGACRSQRVLRGADDHVGLRAGDVGEAGEGLLALSVPAGNGGNGVRVGSDRGAGEGNVEFPEVASAVAGSRRAGLHPELEVVGAVDDVGVRGRVAGGEQAGTSGDVAGLREGTSVPGRGPARNGKLTSVSLPRVGSCMVQVSAAAAGATNAARASAPKSSLLPRESMAETSGCCSV